MTCFYQWYSARKCSRVQISWNFDEGLGTFTNAIQYLSNKALKVIFMIRCRFQTEFINAKLLLKLFDACVKPILLYGSELWSVLNICAEMAFILLIFL